MNIDLFKLALEKLQPSNWESFEQLASAFLATEFQELRTMAHPSGDGGRDSELFSPEGKPFIAFQYSIQEDWKKKIIQTVDRLGEEFPTVKILIYLSNQQIGGQADEIKRSLLEKGLMLDVRDRNWFLERAELGEARQNAAERLIDHIARPYLSGENIINKPSSALTSQEARAALLYLDLQWQDDITDKGLTKLSFDALVRAALRHTHSDNRMTRKKVHEIIQEYLPSANKDQLAHYVDAALSRLTKRYLRHWQQVDEFCLTYEEHQRILAKLAEKENREAAFHSDVKEHSFKCLKDITKDLDAYLTDLSTRIPRVIEKLLLSRGEAFVYAVMTENLYRIGTEQLTDIVLNDLSSNRPESNIIHDMPKIVMTIIQSLFAQSKQSTQHYLRQLANSYTLFSFLRETPDVQTATRKLFSYGKIWLDTTVLLPLFAEQLEEDLALQKFSHLFLTCRDAGIELCVTPGVITEIISHMNTALTCSEYSSAAWRGRIPYLYYQYLQTGKARQDFKKWLLLFRGNERPEDDIAQFLSDAFGIQKVSLSEEAQEIGEKLRWAAERLWTEAHLERRRHAIGDGDDGTTRKLIAHDIETYLGVIALRQREQVTELGYRHWLLTLDSIAWQIRRRLREEFSKETPLSPLLSLDFLINNLTFGPERRHLTRTQEQTLPIVLDVEMYESMPQDILGIADQVRQDNEGLPEYVIRRKVRDAIDHARIRRVCFGISDTYEKEFIS
jgi:hypothetical protein